MRPDIRLQKWTEKKACDEKKVEGRAEASVIQYWAQNSELHEAETTN
jgi:hypothetical protein